jgi:hypothetical protein
LPDWWALTVQVPAPMIETVAPDRLHTPALPAEIVNVTARPEVAVADTVYAGSPIVAPLGGAEVKLIVCVASATANDCCTCGAAW